MVVRTRSPPIGPTWEEALMQGKPLSLAFGSALLTLAVMQIGVSQTASAGADHFRTMTLQPCQVPAAVSAKPKPGAKCWYRCSSHHKLKCCRDSKGHVKCPQVGKC
ncbi:hypothetical protein Psi02_80030 [Planotetraspora silvatica]|uniref:Uncharacterized protein n=1 Tax=Planotetraspora silvatica TaxID=234614 RepID=A0A8J3UT76_9ACTN|nr:hypothetical protein Psi02_80030 [Planotetraspora silvatica]